MCSPPCPPFLCGGECCFGFPNATSGPLMSSISPRLDSKACDEEAAARLAAAIDVPPVVARLLCQRGLSDPELATRFLNPSLDQLHDPMALRDMNVAIERILAAIARKERIAIH